MHTYNPDTCRVEPGLSGVQGHVELGFKHLQNRYHTSRHCCWVLYWGGVGCRATRSGRLRPCIMEGCRPCKCALNKGTQCQKRKLAEKPQKPKGRCGTLWLSSSRTDWYRTGSCPKSLPVHLELRWPFIWAAPLTLEWRCRENLCAHRSGRRALHLGEEQTCPGDVCTCADSHAA